MKARMATLRCININLGAFIHIILKMTIEFTFIITLYGDNIMSLYFYARKNRKKSKNNRFYLHLTL